MPPRFHAPDLDPARREARLAGDEAHHLAKVLRLGVGDEAALFDGRGLEFRARVLAVARDEVRLELLERQEVPAEPRVALTLVQAILKGDRMDAAVRDATMMGAAAIVPLMTAHVAVKASAIERGKPAERWRRVALASVKQCGRATLPVVHEPRTFVEWLGAPSSGERLLFVEPATGQAAPQGVVSSLHPWLDRPAPDRASLIVGPEGGWAPEEIETAIAAGCTPVTLGTLTLRADAVAMVAIALCRFVFRE